DAVERDRADGDEVGRKLRIELDRYHPRVRERLDGISLTVARLADDHLTVAIIPYTWEHTTMHAWQPGRRINLEFDVLGKYVVRALETGLIDTLPTLAR
ncbi:MAG: hypothetical protein AAFV01_14650, partial [Bacteroidota bacterium]